MVNGIKLLKSAGKFFGVLLLFIGLTASIQLSYAEKLTDPEDGKLVNFLEKEISSTISEKCAQENISEENCDKLAEEASGKIKKELTSKEGPLVKPHNISSKYKPIAYILAVAGALLIIFSVGLELNLLKTFGSVSLSIGIVNLIAYFALGKFLMPKLTELGPSEGIEMGEIIRKFVTQEVLPHQLFTAEIFLIAGITLTLSYYIINHFLKEKSVH